MCPVYCVAECVYVLGLRVPARYILSLSLSLAIAIAIAIAKSLSTQYSYNQLTIERSSSRTELNSSSLSSHSRPPPQPPPLLLQPWPTTAKLNAPSLNLSICSLNRDNNLLRWIERGRGTNANYLLFPC